MIVDFIQKQILLRLAMVVVGILVAVVGLINPDWALDGLYSGQGMKK